MFDFLRKLRIGNETDNPRRDAAMPNQYESPVDVIAATLAQLDEDHWATFEARHARNEAVIVEVAGPPDYSISTCLDEVDLPAIARSIGLTGMAECITRGGKRGDDATLHVVNGASIAELAELVNAIFTVHHRLPPDYSIQGELQH